MGSRNSTTIEFSVDLSCQNCVDKTSAVLRSKADEIADFKIDLERQSVVVTTTLPTAEVQQLLESTGKRAVVVGLGQLGQLGGGGAPTLAAVAAVGGDLGCGGGGVRGVVRFVQVSADSCLIDGTIDGLLPGARHALAIHECGDVSGGCGTLGGHYDHPAAGRAGGRHGGPGRPERHVGDLGNIVADESGRASFRFEDDLVRVQDVIGRSVAVAEGEDDLGEGQHPDSKINGNCGGLLSCGIIARSSGLFQNEKKFCACDGVAIWDERDKPAAGSARRAEAAAVGQQQH